MKISWLPEHIIETGYLGLTHTPGAYQGSRDEDLAFLAAEGVQRIVCLQEPFEFNYVSSGLESLEQRTHVVQSLGMDFTHFPITDFGAPDLEAAVGLVQDIQSDLTEGRRIVIHCFAGLGRAGTIAASLLTARGWSAPDAIEQIRRHRPGAIQSAAQERFVAAFAAAQAAR